MPVSETKKQLHTFIDMIEDETQLEMLSEAAEAYATKQPDILDLLTPGQLKRLQESIRQADEGNLVPHEKVMKMAKEWIKNGAK